MNKTRPRFNIIDKLLILGMIVLIGIAAYLLFFAASDADDVYTFFEVELRGQYPGFEDNIIIGGEIRDSVRNYLLGYVMDKRVLPAEIIVFNNDIQEFVIEYIPNRYDVFLTISGEGEETDSEITINNMPVRVGQEMFLRGRGYAGIGWVTELWTEVR